MLSAKYLTTKYENTEVLREVSVSVEPGSIVSLIGPSGAGKTTLLQALACAVAHTSGSMQVGSRNYCRPSPTVALVFQQLFLWPHLTLRENISLSNRSTTTEIEELITTFDMEDFIDRYPNQTSLGQRQRAALARAIALKPQYLLLDEVTSALDIKQIEMLARCLEKLKKAGVGILLVTHLIPFAQRVSDRILFMDKGKIIEEGGKDLVAHPKKEPTKNFLRYF